MNQIAYWRRTALLVVLIISVISRATPGAAAPRERSNYAILVDAATGKVLWGRNVDVKRPIASTTKMLTAILLLERGKPDDIVVAPPGIDKIEESSLHLRPGEQIPLHDLLYAMLLRSANDTAVAGADYLAGSLPVFAALMNQKALEIGAVNSHFVTPNGLFAPDHYSTAADLAKIACYAVNNLPEFNKIVQTRTYKVHRSIDKGDVWVRNTASTFLKSFPGADGIKTGYIHQAGHCFVGSATRANWRLIAVALNSPVCREDVESLLDYGFANFTRVEAVQKDAPLGAVSVPTAVETTAVAAAREVLAVIKAGDTPPKYITHLTPLAHLPEAPFPAGTKLGTFEVLANGRVQATGDALAAAPAVRKMEIPLLQESGLVAKHGFPWILASMCGIVIIPLFRIINQKFALRARNKARLLLLSSNRMD